MPGRLALGGTGWGLSPEWAVGSVASLLWHRDLEPCGGRALHRRLSNVQVRCSWACKSWLARGRVFCFPYSLLKNSLGSVLFRDL